MEQLEKERIEAASEEVNREFKTLVNAEDLNALKQLQHLVYDSLECFSSTVLLFGTRHSLRLGRLQDSHAVLSHFNEYSENCYAEVSSDFSRNTRLLKSMKSDLDYIFQKLRSLKAKIMATYPDAFPDDSAIEALDRRPDLEIP